MQLTNVILPGRGTDKTYDVEVSEDTNKIISIRPHSATSSQSSSPPSRVIPTLCHPHVHLDKPFLLTSHNDRSELPDYRDLAPKDGSFQEALTNTSKAKQRYNHADLILRGSQLIAESVQAGVTSMRAFVEVDGVTQLKCIQAGVQLRQRFKECCHVQLCVFAQDPVISADKNGPQNREWVEEAVNSFRNDIEALGSTPYVESSDEAQRQNIEWAVDMAIRYKLHLDFHLDYNLASDSAPMLWHVLETLQRRNFVGLNAGKTVVIGHCSRITLFSKEEMQRVSEQINSAGLPVHFVGLPTSDLFMMGRPTSDQAGGQRPRGTMQVLQMIREYNLKACMGINNVGNAFTPWGGVDPLRLASLGCGIYQAGTPQDAELLFECVCALAQEAIGLSNLVTRSLEEGDDALFLVIKNHATIKIEAAEVQVPARQRIGVADIVWDPPEISDRKMIGRLGSILRM